MKIGIQRIRELMDKEKNEENEDEILGEFESLLDLIQGHDGGLGTNE